MAAMMEATSSGCCSCGACPAFSTILTRAFGAVGDLLRGARVALVAAARDGQERQLEREQVGPDRFEHALSGRAQQAGESHRVLRQPAGALLLDQGVGLIGEQRLALPDRDDVLDRRRLDPGRQALVGLGAGGPLGRLFDPGRDADGDEARVAPGIAQGGSQGEPAAERVTDQQGLGAGGGDLSEAALEGVLAVVEQCGRRVEPLGDGRPGAAGCMKPGTKRTGTAIDAFCLARVASRAVEPINRTYAPFAGVCRRAGSLRIVSCGHVSGLAQRAARAHARRPA